MNSVRATLKAARKLLSDPKKWLQRSFAITADGEPVGGDHPDAIRFCALGAIQKVDGRYKIDAEDALDVTCQRLFKKDVPAYNDAQRRTHKEILELFDAAIKDAD